MHFPFSYTEILERIDQINVEAYAKTRNYKSGAVSYLSPYISRGVISTRQVYQHIRAKNIPFHKAEKFIQELAWRDYWQQIWINKENGILEALKNVQTPVVSEEIPHAILHANTGIQAIDEALIQLKETGYMHNHMRMYVASIICNIAQTHWLTGANWMYAQLIDGDVASNHLSWQWVAGANSNKKYYANQENINTFFETNQRNTFLDTSYEELPFITAPDILSKRSSYQSNLNLQQYANTSSINAEPTLIYTTYNLDPLWHKEENLQRVLILEPSHFEKHPIEQKTLDFILQLGQNIEGIKLFVGEFEELKNILGEHTLYYKEHPTTNHFIGIKEDRDWMTKVEGYYPSFFKFWKLAQKELRYA